MAVAIEKNIFEYTDQKLRAHFQNNQPFNQELASTFAYYYEKLSNIAFDSDKKALEEELFTCIKSQVFNGYFMIQELLQHDDTRLEDGWFMQSIGWIARQLPDMLRSITNDNIEEIITNEPLRKLSSKLVVMYEGVYPLLLDISLNTACMGAKWAIKDESEKRGITHYQPEIKGLFDYIDEVVFINPQMYLTCDITTESSEVWTLISSTNTGLDKIAEITVIKHHGLEMGDLFYMNINLKNRLPIAEQQSIIDQLGFRLMNHSDIQREQLQLYAASVEEFYYINNAEEDKEVTKI